MDKVVKTSLIERSLAIRHKLRVHESVEKPQTHEDLAVFLLGKWELEDELNAIEELLAGVRRENVNANKKMIESGIIGKKSAKKSKN